MVFTLSLFEEISERKTTKPCRIRMDAFTSLFRNRRSKFRVYEWSASHALSDELAVSQMDATSIGQMNTNIRNGSRSANERELRVKARLGVGLCQDSYVSPGIRSSPVVDRRFSMIWSTLSRNFRSWMVHPWPSRKFEMSSMTVLWLWSLGSRQKARKSLFSRSNLSIHLCFSAWIPTPITFTNRLYRSNRKNFFG